MRANPERRTGLVFHSPALRKLIFDKLAVRGVLTAIRNSVVPPGERSPESATPGARTYGRLSLQAPVSLMPAAVADGQVAIPAGNPISARTHDISLGGFGLVHATPLPGRHAVMLFSAVAPIGLVVEVTRSYPDGTDSWLSGARILGLVQCGEVPTEIA